MFGREFEDEVLRVARALWPRDQFAGSQNVDGLERDAIFETEDAVHYVECTVDRKADKARKDAEKLEKLLPKLARKYKKPALGWWVTHFEPTADQRDAFSDPNVRLLTLSQFRARHIDALSYLDLREQYAFGSVRNPETGEARYEFEYMELLAADENVSRDATAIATALQEGRRAVVLGDYGAGKSTFARQVFKRLAGEHRKKREARFPIFLNLRDHAGQEDPVEALHRHATALGFSKPDHLVRAWRGGWAILILDGFDELAPRPMVARTARLHDHRRAAMALVRRFLEESASDTGVLLTGRLHYFDNNVSELASALGLRGAFEILRLNELSDEQLKMMLGKAGIETPPAWFPTKPLLVAYLTSRGFADLVVQIAGYDDAAVAWDYLIDAVAERESKMEQQLAPEVVRALMERVACRARSSTSGLGVISEKDLAECFVKECGAAPDERGMVVLQRLPGLGPSSDGSGQRSFVDRQLAEALQSRPTAAFVASPFEDDADFEGWGETLSSFGLASVGHYLRIRNVSAKQLAAAISRALQRKSAATLAADLVLGAAYGGVSLDLVSARISNVWIKELFVSEALCAASGVSFQKSIIEALELAEALEARQEPLAVDCEVLDVTGRRSENDLPAGLFESCTFSGFESYALTTAGLLQGASSVAEGVVMTILKKLYLQAGRGRMESALTRGLGANEQRYVPECLEILRREGLAVPGKAGGNRMWYPTRGGDVKRRVIGILTAPHTCGERALALAAQLE